MVVAGGAAVVHDCGVTARGDAATETEPQPGARARGLLAPLAAVVVVALVAGGASWAFSEHDDCLPAEAPALPAVGWDTVAQPVGGPSAMHVTDADAPGTNLLVEQWCASGLGAARLVTTGGVLFAAVRGEVRALDATTGETWWSADADDHGYYAIESGPVLAAGSVVVAGARSGGVGLLAFEQATGELRWELRKDGFEARNLIVHDGVLFASVGDYGAMSVLAVDASSGAELWESQVAAAKAEMSLSSRVFGLSAARGAVVIALHDLASDTGTLKALDRDGGTELWSRPLEGAPTAGPVVHDGQVTAFGIGRPNGTVFGWSFDVDAGAKVWRTTRPPAEGTTFQQPVTAAAATAAGLYALGADLMLLDPATGDVVAEDYASNFGGMSVAGDKVITCAEITPLGAVTGASLGYDLADGSSTWCPTIGVVANGVYYGIDDDTLRAFG